ncbi:hypothetical protein BGZ49_004643 [Haplosporangium sp. Z 27]|nr:hypothetical protein BGZ49_004643 [Haplosporangium sp. Z 27]
MIHSIRDLVDLASKIHNQRVVGSIWQGKGSTDNFEKAASAMIVPKLELKVEPSSGGGSRDMDIFNAPSQGFNHRQGTLAIQQRTGSSSSLVLHNMPQGARLAQSPSPSPPPQPPSSSPIAPPTSLFSSFHENLSENVHYKPISLGLGCNDGEGVGSRRMMSFMSPDNRIFDFMVLLKLELEFVLNVIHTVPEYRTYLFNREPTEYRALAFAVSKIVVWEMGFPVQAQELALEVLGILVIHDEEEPYYLDLVRNMNSIVREEL